MHITYVFQHDFLIQCKISIIVCGILFPNVRLFSSSKRPKNINKNVQLYNIHATKQTLLFSVVGLDIYCGT